MRKVIIIGCPGSGKSTFARALHGRTGLPLYHLDMLYWNADRTVVPGEVFRERLQDVLQQDEWIIDGNYSSTMELRMAACDTVFFLDYPLEVCLQGIEARKGQPREDMPWIEAIDGEPDEEFLEFIRRFERDNRPKIVRLLETCEDKDVIVFHSREEAQAFLEPVEAAIQRVRRMEKLLDEIAEAVRETPGVVRCDSAWQQKIQELTDYYDGGLWMQDYCRDERGQFPQDLKRGILSQDAVYDLLTEIRGLCSEE